MMTKMSVQTASALTRTATSSRLGIRYSSLLVVSSSLFGSEGLLVLRFERPDEVVGVHGQGVDGEVDARKEDRGRHPASGVEPVQRVDEETHLNSLLWPMAVLTTCPSAGTRTYAAIPILERARSDLLGESVLRRNRRFDHCRASCGMPDGM